MRGLRANVADAETPRRAGKTTVSDQRDFLAHALARKGRSGRQHFAHAGAACGTFVADDKHIAFL